MSDISQMWLIGCSFLVFLMQPGFMLLESSLTRSKNNINVAVKNITDFAFSFISFYSIGYFLMFSEGYSNIFSLEQIDKPFLLFQAMFCGTAATIVSGALAERMRFTSYILISLIISLVVYPFFGRVAWLGIDSAELKGWLGQLGFIDFAGSTVVHSIGA